MPPKKKKAEGGKAKRSAKSPVPGVPAPTPLPEESKEAFFAQIKDLENRLQRLTSDVQIIYITNNNYFLI